MYFTLMSISYAGFEHTCTYTDYMNASPSRRVTCGRKIPIFVFHLCNGAVNVKKRGNLVVFAGSIIKQANIVWLLQTFFGVVDINYL